jgi:hypothetical protein
MLLFDEQPSSLEFGIEGLIFPRCPIIRNLSIFTIMVIKEIIKDRRTVFEHICQSCRVQKLYAFGSSVSEKFDPSASDIDLLVVMDIINPMEKGELLMNFWDQLEDFFQRKVDLLTPSSIKNPFLNENIEATKVLIYDGKQQKVSV